MRIKKIKYSNWANDSLDVFVTLENDDSYLIEVATPQFLSAIMEKSESDFVPVGYPYIIVSNLTDETIRAAIQAYIDTEDDLYWLKLYDIMPTLEIEDINEISERKEKENIELEAKIDAEVEEESDRNH